jgi:hypothetical protein
MSVVDLIPKKVLSLEKNQAMDLLNFVDSYPDETSCKLKFKEIREKEGVICRNCGGTDHYWLSTIEHFKCKKCGTRTTLKSGTVMENSKLPFRYWFVAMHLMTSTKKAFSALEMQRQLGHKFYEPIWSMMHKIRLIMGKRDAKYKLEGEVEIDESYFEISYKKDEDGDEIKRGRGTQQKATVFVMASTKSLNQSEEQNAKKSKKKESKLRYVKMEVLNSLKAKEIEAQVKQSISSKSKIKTDGFRSYSKLYKCVESVESNKVPPEQAGIMLPWVHTMVSNAKRTFAGIHHLMQADYIQNYLDEFCYKVNRRYFGQNIFERLLIASATNRWF